MKAKDAEIIVLKDADFATISRQLKVIQLDYVVNNDTKTLIWVYYSGHGVMQNTSYAVCNESVKKTKVVYPLEKQLRVLANLQGIYVVAVFDCCRAAVTKAMKE